jgi:hypothetical protein
MKYRLFILPDNGDASVEDFATFEAAANRAAAIVQIDDPDWPKAEIIALLARGGEPTFHDYSSVRIDTIS